MKVLYFTLARTAAIMCSRGGWKLPYIRFHNYRIVSSMDGGTSVLTEERCWKFCIDNRGCYAVHFNVISGSCEVVQRISDNYPVQFVRGDGWVVFIKHSPFVSLEAKSYSLDFVSANAYCAQIGLSIASFEDLNAAYRTGYQSCSCGWAADGQAYLVMQNGIDICSGDIGVSRCTGQSTWNVYCKPLKSVINKGSPTGHYSMTLAQARSHCVSQGTSLATMEDLLKAYHRGDKGGTCGWIDNGYAYMVCQEPSEECNLSVGILLCEYQSKWNAWCKDN